MNNCQGTFLHQARRAKVQERRQQETLNERLQILNSCPVSD